MIMIMKNNNEWLPRQKKTKKMIEISPRPIWDYKQAYIDT